MSTDTVKSDHHLLQTLTTISRLDLNQLDVAMVAIQLGNILQSLLPHDFINLTWCEVKGEDVYLRETTMPGCMVDRWPLSAALRQNEPMLIDDYMKEESLEGRPNPLLRCALLIPLQSAKDMIGVLEPGSKTPHAFPPAQCDRAAILAGTALRRNLYKR